DGHARDAGKGVGDVRVRELADVLGEHGVGQAHVVALLVRRQGQRTAVTAHGDGRNDRFIFLRGRWRRGRGGGFRGVLRVGARNQAGDNGGDENIPSLTESTPSGSLQLFGHAC